MAGLVSPDDPKAADYQGLDAIFEFVNDDGTCVLTNCGQAAATTLLTHYGALVPAADEPTSVLQHIEKVFPPDNLGGYFGTSRRRVTRICKAHGLRLKEVRGEEALRFMLAQRRPVIVMLGVSAGRFLGFDLPGGHWMVAYGFDENHVYLTNGGKITWDEFRAGWNGFVPRLIQMRQRGLVIR